MDGVNGGSLVAAVAAAAQGVVGSDEVRNGRFPLIQPHTQMHQNIIRIRRLPKQPKQQWQKLRRLLPQLAFQPHRLINRPFVNQRQQQRIDRALQQPHQPANQQQQQQQYPRC